MPTANWKRLGGLLVRRRIELDPRYSNRQLFAAERGLNYRTVSDIERGRRDNYENGTITALEVAYRVTPGSVGRALAGGDLEPLRARPPLRPVPADQPPAPAGSPSEAERARLIAGYPDDEVLQVIGRQRGKKASMVVAEMLEWLDTQASHSSNGTSG